MLVSRLWGSGSLLSLLILFGVSCALAVFALWQMLKPVHRRRPPPGKQWKLSPGPAGHALFGNLKEVRGAGKV